MIESLYDRQPDQPTRLQLEGRRFFVPAALFTGLLLIGGETGLLRKGIEYICTPLEETARQKELPQSAKQDGIEHHTQYVDFNPAEELLSRYSVEW